MWPWAHVAVAYLGLSALQYRRVPTEHAVILAGIGAILPDLIDKTLAWYVGVLPHGRSFAHSLLLGGAIVVAAYGVSRRVGGARFVGPFTLGYLLHIAGDAYQPVLFGALDELGFLGWPVLSLPSDETIGLTAHLLSIQLTPFFAAELAVTGLGLALWLRHGCPGLAWTRRWLAARLRATLALL